MREIFNRAGQVTSVRVVVDKDTKQPKGYAFIDFADSASAQAAVEKLSNYDYNGRKLRVDGAERELSSRPGDRGGGPGDRGPPGGPHGGFGFRGGGGGGDAELAPSKPNTVDKVQQIREQAALEQAKAAAMEGAERSEIARLMETLSPLQLLHVVGEMQRLAVSAPEVARALVSENVQLGLALQHAEFLVGLLEEPSLPTDAEVKERAKSVREKLWQAGGPAVPPPPGGARGMPPMPVGTPMPTGGAPMQYMAAPYGPMMATMVSTAQHPGTPYARAVASRDPRLGGVLGTAMQALGPPAMVQPPGTPVAVAAPLPAAVQQQGLLERLVQLSPAQIDQLPHEQKVQLLQFLQTLPANAS